MSRARRLLRAWLLLLSVVSCASVPDIRFVDDRDASPGEAQDGGELDAADGASGACPQPAPAAGGTCCGTIWCFDRCDEPSCSACANLGCAPGQVCCGRGTVSCKAKCN